MENHQMTTPTTVNAVDALVTTINRNTTMASSIINQVNPSVSKPLQQQQACSAKNSDGQKPLEMNTYIQLEMENSSCCVPRVCKFCVKALSFQTDLVSSSAASSVILAVKLEVSKRSLRSVEIPLVKSSNRTNNSCTDLNLNYNITYPHFLKKDSNTLYFYIQRRKKYKTRTILGYKTLAYGFIDLATVMQRPFSRDLPLYLKTNSVNSSKMMTANELSSQSQANLKNNNNRVLIGTLNIFMLVSQPYEIVDPLESNNNFNYFRNTIDSLKSEIDDVFDDYDEFNEYLLENKMNMSKANNLKSNGGARMSIGNGEAMGQRRETDENHPRKSSNSTEPPCVFSPSDSDNEAELDNLKKRDENLNDRKTNSNSKKLTGKIISFIRKLRNENVNVGEVGEVGEGDEEADYFEEEEDEEETQNETVTILNEDEDFDVDDIEQVTDYGESDNDQDDAYSIVSTPKPKLQPFFSNQLSFKDSTVLINKNNPEFNAFGGLSASSNSLNENKNGGCDVTLDENVKLAQKFEYKLMNISTNNDLFILIDENDSLLKRFDQELNFETHLLIRNWHELGVFNETVTKLIQTDNFRKFNPTIKLGIIGDDQFLNRYVQSYIQIINENETLSQLIKHFFVPRKRSILASYIGRLNFTYFNMFCDEFWSKLDDSIANCGVFFKDIWERLTQYFSKNETSTISFQIGECLLNTSMRLDMETNSSSSTCKNNFSVPFLCDVRIQFPLFVDENKSINQSLTSSNSMPQFNMNIMEYDNSSLYNKNDRYNQYMSYLSNSSFRSPSNSLLDPQYQDEFGYNLQLDYWNLSMISTGNVSSTFSAPSIATSMNQVISKENIFNKSNKSSVKALFKSLQIFRSNFVKPSSNLPSSKSGLNTSFGSMNMQEIIDPLNDLTIIYLIKEKKQKIMRLAKKSKESEHKETIEGLTKLVCQAKNPPTFNVCIDEIEYENIKSLQMTSLWQGKIKKLNIAIP